MNFPAAFEKYLSFLFSSDNRLRLIVVLVTATACAYVGIKSPHLNYDLVGYLANVVRLNQGASIVDTHQTVFRDLNKISDAKKLDELLGNVLSVDQKTAEYRKSVAQDPQALEYTRRFFSVRVLYASMIDLFNQSGVDLVRSSTYVSSIFSFLAVLAFGYLLFPKGIPVLLFPIVVLATGFEEVARISSPDSLFALVSVLAYWLFLRGSKWLILIIILMPLVRPDSVVLSVLLGIALMIFSKHRLAVAFAVFAAIALYAMLGHEYQAHGWLRVFQFSFFELSTSIESPLNPRTLSEIAYVYAQGVRNTMLSPFSLVWLLLFLLFVHPGNFLRTVEKKHLALLAISFGFVAIHIIALPFYQNRYFVTMHAFSAITLLSMTYLNPRG